MIKYIKFAFRFATTYYNKQIFPYFGVLPFYKIVKPGTVAKVQGGGEFKYVDLYVCTASGWLRFESGEQKILNDPAYLKQQEEIKKELKALVQGNEDDGIFYN